MKDDHIFQCILIAGFAAIVPLAVYHRWRAATSEKLDRRQEGLFIFISLRILGLYGMTSLVCYMIDPVSMAWSSAPLLPELRWTGVVLGILAVSLLLWTFHSLGKNITDTVVTLKVHSLVQTGPYRWVRHPFYVSFALAVLANSLVTANWFIFLIGATAFLLIVLRTGKEEALLVERFGDDYRRYMESTGRFWPRFSIRRVREM